MAPLRRPKHHRRADPSTAAAPTRVPLSRQAREVGVEIAEEKEDDHNEEEKEKEDGLPEAEDREKDVPEEDVLEEDVPEEDDGGGRAGGGRVRRRRPRVKGEDVFKINTITH